MWSFQQPAAQTQRTCISFLFFLARLELFQPSCVSFANRCVLLLLHYYLLLSLLQFLTELTILSDSIAILDERKGYDGHSQTEEPEQTTRPRNSQ